MQTHSEERRNARVPDKTRGRIAFKYRPIGDLKLALKNMRANSPGQILQVARSIDTFGFSIPLFVDVIVGHAPIIASQFFDSAEVPTLRVEHLSDAETQAF